MKKYTKTHEWVELEEADLVKVGITKEGLKQLGEIVYIELPKIDSLILKGQESVVLESTKAAVDHYSPVSGKVVEVNNALLENIELLNLFPEEKGWLYKLKLANQAELDLLING